MLIKGLEHHLLETNGTRLHVVLAGPHDGQPVFLLHGFPDFWYGWRHQIEALAEAGFRLWIPDQRGYNLSEKPQGVEAYLLDEMVLDIIGLMDAAGLTKIDLVGHDWGGGVAWRIAQKFPDRSNRLIILNSPHGSVMVKHLRSNPRQMLRSWYMFFFRIPWLPESLLRMGHWSYLARALRKSSRPGTFTDDDLEFYKRAWSPPGAITAMLNWYRAIFRMRPKYPLISNRISVPTLLIWGEQDKALGKELAQPSVERCEDGRLALIAEAGHWVQQEEPRRVNHLILEFLRKAQ